jgi:hypothetical protein
MSKDDAHLFGVALLELVGVCGYTAKPFDFLGMVVGALTAPCRSSPPGRRLS